MSGLTLLAQEEGWTEHLKFHEARRAAQHGIFTDVGTPPGWLSPLLSRWPEAVEPLLIDEMRREWAQGKDGYSPFLHRYEALAEPVTPGIRALIFEQALGPEPESEERTSLGVATNRGVWSFPGQNAGR